MSRKGIKPQSAHHVMFYDEDWKFLSEMYGPKGINSNVSISEAVKTIVHLKVTALRAKIDRKIDENLT